MSIYRGKRAFDRCKVMDISYREDPEKPKDFTGRLVCAATEDKPDLEVIESGNYKPDIYFYVRRSAARIACSHCVYAGMNSVEVSNYRKELAEAEIARIQAAQQLADMQEDGPLPGQLEFGIE